MIRVLIVDDSAVVRKLLTDELSKYKDIDVVGSAIDPYIARDKIVRFHPDVITLDLNMPRMDGLSFLQKLMKYSPMPVVVVSSLTPKNSESAIRALEMGAVEVICKPNSASASGNISRQLVHAIRAAASARIRRRRKTMESPVVRTPTRHLRLQTTHKVVAIGASTGGTKAIETVLSSLPAKTPGTVIVQHMPEYFTASFAERLNQICKMEVREASEYDNVVPGVALVAPGDKHMLLQKSGTRYHVITKGGPAVHHQRPSVDVLFQSVAHSAGRNAIGVLLTGMGDDGAKGLLAMRESGARTLAQDEQSCIIFGMPKEAIKLGAADEVVSLPHIADTIVTILSQKGIKKQTTKGGGLQ